MSFMSNESLVVPGISVQIHINNVLSMSIYNDEGIEELKDFVDIGECSIVKGETQDTDWINNWKQYPVKIRNFSCGI